MKQVLVLFHVDKVSDERIQVSISALLLVFVFLYQIIKLRLSFHYENSLGEEIHTNLPAAICLVAISILLFVFVPRITGLTNKIVIALVIIGSSLAFSASYTLTRGIDWTGSDVSEDSFGLAEEVQMQGISDFVATYNDRGNPGMPGSSSYANSVYDALRALGLEQMAQSYWVGKMKTTFVRPLMHPPTFFIILAGWQYLFGNTPLSATLFMWISTAIWGLICFILLEAIQSKASTFLTLLFITTPTTFIDTWFPTYDVASGTLLMIGYGLFILAISQRNSWLILFSSLALGASVMFRLTSLYFVALVPIILLYLVIRGRQPLSGIILFLIGLSFFPIALYIAGYNPILTLVTAKFRQDTYYGERVISLLSRLPVFLYLGIPLITLYGFGILRHFRELPRDIGWLWILLPVAAMIPIAMTTRLTSDFHRNMMGVSACFILAISLLGNFPESRIRQAFLIGINLCFVLLITLL